MRVGGRISKKNANLGGGGRMSGQGPSGGAQGGGVQAEREGSSMETGGLRAGQDREIGFNILVRSTGVNGRLKALDDSQDRSDVQKF